MNKRTPFPHQVKGLNYLISRKSGFLFYKMRLGKTMTVILAIKKLREYPVLIVAPKITLSVWKEELRAEGLKYSAIGILDHPTRPKNEKILSQNYPVFITNFEKMKNYDILNAKEWRVVIVDELDRLANYSTQITKYFRRNRPKTYQRRYGLSGTPAPETALNIVSEYIVIQGHFRGYNNMNKYLLDHWEKNPFSGKWEPKKKNHIDEIIAYVKQTACIATMKDVGKGAIFTFTHRVVKANNAQKKLFKKADLIKKQTQIQGGIGLEMDPAVLVNRLHHKMISAGIDPYEKTMVSDAKAKEAVDYWQWYKEPMLIVSAFIEPIDFTANMFRKAGAKVGVIHGGVKFKERDRLRLAFAAGKLDIIVAQTKSIKMGLNFSAADVLMVLSNTDSGSDREQLVDRIQHMDAKNPKQVIDIFTEDSRDSKFLSALGLKEEGSIKYFE